MKRLIIGLVVLMIGLALYFYLSAFMPIILAFVTAFVLEPLVKVVQKYFRIKKRLPAVTIVFLLFVCLIITSFYFMVTQIIHEAIQFVDRLPYYVAEVNSFNDELILDLNEAVSELPPEIIKELHSQSNALFKKGQTLAKEAIPMLASWAQQLPNLFVVTLVYLITLFLISMDLPNLRHYFYSHFREDNATKVRYMSQRLGTVFIGFFKAQFLVSIVIFVVTYIGLLLITPRNALLMALIIWIIDFIPLIGSIVILAPWALFEFVTGATSMSIQLLILAGVLLALRRSLEPIVMGEHIGLSALSTLLSIYFGLYFLGFVGLIAGPLFIIALKSATEAGLIKADFKI
jgi:sporulation integral membrane protein YtvI